LYSSYNIIRNIGLRRESWLDI